MWSKISLCLNHKQNLVVSKFMQELFSFYCLYLPNKGSMQIDNITGHLKADAINV